MKLSKFLIAIGAVAALSFNAHAAISVGVNGVGPLTFDTLPTVAEGWSTITHTGGSGDITTGAALDTQVNTNEAAAIVTPLGSSGTVDGISAAGIARWNSALLSIMTPPTGVGYVSVLATLQNDSGADISAITLSYDVGQNNSPAAGVVVVEEVPAQRLYYSLSGSAGTWTEVPDAEAPNAAFTGARNATLALGSWPAGTALYILWADDNAAADRNNAGNEEGGYTIDNFAITVGSTIVAITSPGNNASVAFGTPIPISATASMPGTVLNVAFYDGTTLLGNDTTGSPYTFLFNGAALGIHDLTIVANDSLGNIRTSAVVRVTINPNNGAAVVITTPTANELLVASNVVLTATATDADGSVTQVQFRDGNTPIGAADTTAPYTMNYRPLSAGTHTFTAVATDNLGLLSTSAPVRITVVQPLNSLVAFGATWKYLDDGSDQGNAWFNVDDTAWASGGAELGYGDLDEVTTVGFGGNAAMKHITTYFKHHFDAPNAASITDIAIRLEVDDGAVVYLNGQPVMFVNMPTDINMVTYTTFALANSPEELVVGTNLVVDFDIAQLQPTDNVIAVEVHQSGIASSDISFNLELIANPGANPPLVSLLTPTNSQALVAPDPINVSAVAIDKDGGVVTVDFYVDNVLVGSVLNPPYAGSIASTAGTHLISAVAVDNSGLSSTSSVTIVVGAGPVFTTLVNSNSVWSYIDNGSDQGTAWQALAFDATSWTNGPAELGYGDGDEAHLVSFGPDANAKYVTTYFRHLFNVTDVASATNLIVRLKRDDGGIVYINGTEVFRDNMPAAPTDYLTLAGGAIGSETAFFSTNVNPSVLVNGQNVVAVEVHQNTLNSSDLSFDLQLQSVSAPVAAGPKLTITLASPTSVTISWTPNTPGFRLVQSGSVLGPWTTSPSQVNGQTVTPIPGNRFYKLQNP